MAGSTAGVDGVPIHVYTIGGVRVEFPVKAYPSQIAIMDKVIRGLQRGQHCLLESPTGSGKTLALLCATLAWQQAEAERVRSHNESVDAMLRDMDTEKRAVVATVLSTEQVKPLDRMEEDPKEEEPELEEYNSDDDFKPTTKRSKIQPTRKTSPKTPVSDKPVLETKPEVEVETPNIDIPKKKRIPKIFFGTRTHKQIAQVIKEFRRTVYCKTPMTVLGSREHTCIHPSVSQSFNKNEGCRELTDMKKSHQTGQTCSFYHQASQKLRTHSVMLSHGYQNGWDLEDLVKVGRKLRACPYYGSRQLMDGARIIFSPYNYLVDPRIRQSMNIFLEGNVIVLDEAHNIEDSAREAASGSFSLEDFKHAMEDCEKVAPRSSNRAELETLASFCSSISTWIHKYASSLQQVDLDRNVSTMTGTEFIARLSEESYPPERFPEIREIAKRVFTDEANLEFLSEDKEQAEPQLSGATRSLLEGFLTIMDLMLEDNQRHRDDYRVAVMRTIERRRNLEHNGAWYNKGPMTSSFTYTLHLWCLNPAVVLKEVRKQTRSIIVSSGTLSPLASYQSELDIEFKITLEAGHVIPADRVWVGTVSRGPQQTCLNGTFHSVNTYAFQDELGRLVLDVCRTVPHGVLCFLSSYGMLEKLATRWQATGLWQDIFSVKTIVCEPRDSSEFDVMMNEFYSAVADTKGALMLAVCRGKVSEGLDFADNNARAVICVGIPFPNIKDTQVELKRAYNDHMIKTKKLLTGSEWYEIQAFRALNQALGRCIRHRKDWGAIILVDDRYSKVNRYVNALSKWVRNSIKHYHLFDNMLTSLKEFTELRKAEIEEIPSTPITQPEPTPRTPTSGASPYFLLGSNTPKPPQMKKSQAVMLQKGANYYNPGSHTEQEIQKVPSQDVIVIDED